MIEGYYNTDRPSNLIIKELVEVIELLDRKLNKTKMSKTTVHLPEDFSWYAKETRETIIKSIKKYGDKVTILPIPLNLSEHLNQNKDEEID